MFQSLFKKISVSSQGLTLDFGLRLVLLLSFKASNQIITKIYTYTFYDNIYIHLNLFYVHPTYLSPSPSPPPTLFVHFSLSCILFLIFNCWKFAAFTFFARRQRSKCVKCLKRTSFRLARSFSTSFVASFLFFSNIFFVLSFSFRFDV
jgi:hypothetical protein